MIASCSASRVRPDPSQDGLQFGKGPLNGGEIGRVRGKKQELAASGFDGLFHLRPQVNREIIQNDDLSGTQSF